MVLAQMVLEVEDVADEEEIHDDALEVISGWVNFFAQLLLHKRDGEARRSHETVVQPLKLDGHDCTVEEEAIQRGPDNFQDLLANRPNLCQSI
jgi:hypothetical protein